MNNIFPPHQFRWPNKTEWTDICVWTGLTIVLGLLPLWGGALIRLVAAKPLSWDNFVGHGEFALYTASIVPGTIYSVSRNFPNTNFPFRPVFILLTVLLAVWSTLISGGVFAGEERAPSAELMAWLTIPAFLLSMLLAVFVMLLERQLVLPDPHAEAAKGIDDLGEKVRKRRKKGGETNDE